MRSDRKGWDACTLQCLSPPHYASHLLGSRNLVRSLRVNGPSDSARRREAGPHLAQQVRYRASTQVACQASILSLPRESKSTLIVSVPLVLCSPNAHSQKAEGGGWSPGAPAMGTPHGSVAAWLRKLVPSRTSSERTIEHCVSPSLTRSQRQSHAPIASRNSRPSTSIQSKTSELGRSK